MLDCVVFGKVAGQKAFEFAKSVHDGTDKALVESFFQKERKRVAAFQKGSGTEEPSALREEVRAILTKKVAIFRSGFDLEEALEQVRRLRARFSRLRPISLDRVFNLDLIRTFELRAILELAEIITASALARRESRGAHVRIDFPQRDDKHFLRHTLAHYTREGPRLEYSDAKITHYKPEERKY